MSKIIFECHPWRSKWNIHTTDNNCMAYSFSSTRPLYVHICEIVVVVVPPRLVASSLFTHLLLLLLLRSHQANSSAWLCCFYLRCSWSTGSSSGRRWGMKLCPYSPACVTWMMNNWIASGAMTNMENNEQTTEWGHGSPWNAFWDCLFIQTEVTGLWLYSIHGDRYRTRSSAAYTEEECWESSRV